MNLITGLYECPLISVSLELILLLLLLLDSEQPKRETGYIAWNYNQMDATQKEKIYVAVGNDSQDGFKTLNWALKKWNSQPISIVILHVTHNFSKDYVYTPCEYIYGHVHQGFFYFFLFYLH